MEPTHQPQAETQQSSLDSPENASGGGTFLSPPAFQLSADAAQSDMEHGPDIPELEGIPMEADGGVYPVDAVVVGGDANILDGRTSSATVVGTIPNGEMVPVYADRGGYSFVISGSTRGWVIATSLIQVSARFSRNSTLMECLTGTSSLSSGASGLPVRVLQQALVEAGFLAMGQVDGAYGTITTDAVKAFQTSKSITDSGTLNADTMRALNTHFFTHAVEGAHLAANRPATDATEGVERTPATTPAELLNGTRNISTDEQTAFENAINIEPRTSTGAPPTFTETVGGQTYGDRITAALDSIIPAMFARMADGRAAQRADPANLHDWGQIEDVAAQSKSATDAQFGGYRVGGDMTATGTPARIYDAWENKESRLAADPSVADSWVEWRVRKLLTGHATIAAIDEVHGAVQSRAAEAAIISPIKTTMMTRYRTELIEIHKAWPAFASGGNVYIQRFVEHDTTGAVDQAAGRDYMWDIFQTVIHEYIHTLEHSNHLAYRSGIGDAQGGFVLREGTTDYFTKVVYNNTNKTDPSLRQTVEGPFHDPSATHDIPQLGTYGQSREAEEAAGIIGFPNMAAAFFLGRTDLYEHS